MPSPFVAVLLLVLAPIAYLAARSVLLARRPVRWAAAAIAGAALVASFPREGVDFVHVKRLNLLITVAAALVLAWLHATPGGPAAGEGESGGAGSAERRERQARRLLTALALLAAVGWLNFFSFHGRRTWIHLHDVAHYDLGSKYHAELGYGDLYTGMLRAEAETHGDRFRALEARDLATHEQVDIRVLLGRSDSVKERFTPERWASFKRDVDFFRSRLAAQYGAVLLDHGFNPTPVWALAGGWLGNRVPAGSHAGILALTLIDPILVLSALALAGWAYGLHAATLALLHFCVIFGATFGWTGGAFMRQAWFLAVVACACLLQKRRHAAAGAALALAASLRVFPVLFLLPPAFKAGWAVAAKLRATGPGNLLAWAPPRRWNAFFAGFSATALVLVGATLLAPGGWASWSAFATNLETHAASIAPNIVGLTEALSWRSGAGKVTQEELRDLKLRRQKIYAAQILLVFLPLVAVAAWTSRRFTDAACLTLAMPLTLAGLSLASYYHVFLVLLVLAFRKRPRELSLIFAAEAVSYALMLFEEREALLYVYRAVALAMLYAILLQDPIRREWRRLSSGRPPGRTRPAS